MADAIPPPVTALAEVSAKFRHKVVATHRPAGGGVGGDSRLPVRRTSLGTAGGQRSPTLRMSPSPSERGGGVGAGAGEGGLGGDGWGAAGSGGAVPPLTILALNALVSGFAAHPNLRGLPPKYANAVAARLPTDLDVTVAAPHVDDEAYWKRVATQAHRFTKVEVAQHGGSWKQLCLERYLSARLEGFGVHADMPTAEYEDDFCRPPLDATHPLWSRLYPKVHRTRQDGRPQRERCSANTVAAVTTGIDGSLAIDLDSDAALALGPVTGWPHLDRLKQVAAEALDAFKGQHAWSGVDVTELRAVDPVHVAAVLELEGGGETARSATTTTVVTGLGGSGGRGLPPTLTARDVLAAMAVNLVPKPPTSATLSAAPAVKPPSSAGRRGSGTSMSVTGGMGKKGGKDAGAGGPPPPPPPNPLMKPFPAAAHAIHEVEDAFHAQYQDVLDGRGTGMQLREYVPPAALEGFRKTGVWPRERGDSILAIRSRQLARLLEEVAAVGDWVFTLHVEQFPSHCDLELVASRLPNLTSLHLTYGMRHLGMKYDRALFGMRLTDAESIARCLRMTDTLTHLALPSNLIDDNLLMVLLSGLLDNNTLISLDLSHNAITSIGAQLVAKALKPPSQLATLNLADNHLDERAGAHLGRVLAVNDGLVELNLRLNALGDDGARALLEGLRGNTTLTTLNLSSNRVGSVGAAALATLLTSRDTALTIIQLSANALREEDAAVLHRAMASNSVVTCLDVRGNTAIPDDSESVQGIFWATRSNEVKARTASGVGLPL